MKFLIKAWEKLHVVKNYKLGFNEEKCEIVPQV